MIKANQPGIAGYHGTSIEAVAKLISDKKLPNSGIEPNRFSIIPASYICDWDCIGWYANQIAARHFLAENIGFPVPDHGYLLYLQALVDERLSTFRYGVYSVYTVLWRELARENHTTIGELIELVRRGYDERKGCVLTISDSINDLEVTFDTGDKTSFEAPGGLSDKYVLEIEPKGDYEHTRLDLIMNSRKDILF